MLAGARDGLSETGKSDVDNRTIPDRKQSGGIAADKLRSFIERIERLNADIAGLNADKADIFKEAKSDGFDPKIMKVVIRRRAMTTAEAAAQDDLVTLYERAIDGEEAG